MKFTDLLTEGINDKYIFKAVFLAGGPGFGKSFISKHMFGLPDNPKDENKIRKYVLQPTVAGIGAKSLNSDDIFEYKLKKNNLPLDVNSDDIETYKLQIQHRDTSKELTKLKLMQWQNGMLPLIIDGTAKRVDKIEDQKKALEALGYDTAMVFVDTSLEIAMDRNKKRERVVDEKIVKDSWTKVQKNKEPFERLFKKDFYSEPNNEVLDDQGIKKMGLRLFKKANKFFGRNLKNPIGQNTIKVLRATGGKYLSDLPKGMIE